LIIAFLVSLLFLPKLAPTLLGLFVPPACRNQHDLAFVYPALLIASILREFFIKSYDSHHQVWKKMIRYKTYMLGESKWGCDMSQFRWPRWVNKVGKWFPKRGNEHSV
jgi:hypothetical protein